MCGRYASFRQAQDLADIFSVDLINPVAQKILPSWNVAPTQEARIVLETHGGGEIARVLEAAKWGLVPHWAKDPSIGSRMINARSETITEKPSFRGPAKYYRCVVPVEGYYEWKAAPEGKRAKTPFFIHAADDAPLALAGLYSWWQEELLTFTIATRAARGKMQELHDREPVILLPESIDEWLNPAAQEKDDVEEILARPAPPLDWYEVSTMVNAVRNNSPDLIEPVNR